MNKLSLALGAVALALLPASSALADTFNFNFTDAGSLQGPSFSGSGTFTATNTSGNDWLVTGITGQVNGYSIVALLAPNTYPTGNPIIGPNDNMLYYPPNLGFGPSYFDNSGVAFELAGNIDVNLNDAFGFEFAVGGINGDIQAQEFTSVCVTDASPSPTPEPGSLFLLGTGVLGVAGALRRKIGAAAASIA